VNLPFFIAKRYLLHQKGAFSAFIIRLAILATSLSVATMVIAVSFVGGFQYEIREKIFSFWGHVHITPFTANASTIISPNPIKREPGLEQQIMHRYPVVQSVSPFIVRPVMINTNKLMEGIQLKGVDAKYTLPKGIGLEGKPIDFSDSAYSRQILLSRTTADRLNVKAGDEIQLYFLEPGSTFPRIRKVEVAGMFHTGMDEVDRQYGLCDMRLLQRVNNWAADDINGYQVMLSDDAYSDTIATQVYVDYLQPPLTTYTMKEIFPNIIDWLQMQDVTTRVIIIIMTIVAIINLVVVLLILIVEHARMVGVLKAMGMTLNNIRKIFLYHSALIALLGIVIGDIIGLGICWLQKKTGFIELPESTYYIKQAAVRVIWWQPVLIDVATLVICVLCMWLPTLYIRRIQPARVLQFK
jgi:lipoprotein-releasing system permease protein